MTMPTKSVLQEYVDEKLSDRDIGNELGVTSRTVLRWRIAAGIASKWERPRAPHGTASRYTSGGCRCEPCTRANTEACRKHTGAKKRTEPDHGTISRYRHRGCRCDQCRGANAAAMRKRRARLTAATS